MIATRSGSLAEAGQVIIPAYYDSLPGTPGADWHTIFDRYAAGWDLPAIDFPLPDI